jgi:hypothetical protein
MPGQQAKLNEKRAYEAMIDIFYGKIFKIYPDYIVEEVEKTFREINKNFDEHCVKEEGWYNIEHVYEMVEHVKRLTPVELTQFTRECPSKLLTKFILGNLRAIFLQNK